MAEDTENETPENAEPDAKAGEQAEPQQAAETPAKPAATATEAESAEQLAPKERRRRARSTHTGEARPSRTAEERHAERAAERRAKAIKRRARRLQERAKASERRAAGGRDSVKEPLPPVHAPVEGARKVRQGVVVSNKADKTITVRIDVARRHRRYQKIVRSSSTLHAHDESNEAHEGDVVRVIESRPLSRTKRWKLVDVLERAR
jgi:small subunit ribosomal protein S17